MLRRAGHSGLLLTLVTVLLYGGIVIAATEPMQPRALRAEEAANAPHIALLLPIGSDPFAQASEAVRAGFFDASKKSVPLALPIRVYGASEDTQTVIASYRRAIAAGAQIVVGPLTRSGVTALASAPYLIRVPTLALNVPESPARAAQLYVLSLHVEAEAHQIARLAANEGRRKAFTVSGPTPLARRMREAFIDEFERRGGHHIAEYAYPTDAASLERLRQAASLGVADVVFFAMDAAHLRAIRAHLLPMPGYGTSHVNPGQSAESTLAELSDVRFVDMPWMVQPDHPAVVAYARSGPREAADLERLYALGVDAFRAAENLLAGKLHAEIDGVTGKLRLGADGEFRRALLVTLIAGGTLVVLGETAP